MSGPVIEVQDLVRKFGPRTVLNGVGFSVNKGDTMIIMGGSGCGKSTLLRHIIAEARARGMTSLWLETGTPADFLPAQRLYESEGFVACGPFEDYADDPFSLFMTKTL